MFYSVNSRNFRDEGTWRFQLKSGIISHFSTADGTECCLNLIAASGPDGRCLIPVFFACHTVAANAKKSTYSRMLQI